ncbi:MAG: hypothetical protein HOP20_10805 [Sulfuriferula sp.]|nr:hypothetical protein [Sulfuriferula sp.]
MTWHSPTAFSKSLLATRRLSTAWRRLACNLRLHIN